MIGNDACGNRSVRHGRTSSHIEALELVTADGVRAVADRTGLRAADPDDPERRAAGRPARSRGAAPDRRRTWPRSAPSWAAFRARSPATSCTTCCPSTASTWPAPWSAPRAPARSSPPRRSAWCPPPATRAARPSATTTSSTPREDVPEILRWDPTAVEGMDEAIVATMRARRGPDSVTGLPEGRAWLYVELDGDDRGGSRAPRAAGLLDALKARGRTTGGRVVESAAERALAVAGPRGRGRSRRPSRRTAGSPGPAGRTRRSRPRTWPPTCADFRKLLATHGLTGVLYGHFGAGCVHVRIDFDLATDDGRAAHPPVPAGGGRPGRRARRNPVGRARRRPGARRAAGGDVQPPA